MSMTKQEGAAAVSYTHLDVYKRQVDMYALTAMLTAKRVSVTSVNISMRLLS